MIAISIEINEIANRKAIGKKSMKLRVGFFKVSTKLTNL